VYVGVSVVCTHVGHAGVGALQVCGWPIRMSDLFFFSWAYVMKFLSSSSGLLLDIYIYIYIYTTLLPLASAQAVLAEENHPYNGRARGVSVYLHFTF